MLWLLLLILAPLWFAVTTIHRCSPFHIYAAYTFMAANAEDRVLWWTSMGGMQRIPHKTVDTSNGGRDEPSHGWKAACTATRGMSWKVFLGMRRQVTCLVLAAANGKCYVAEKQPADAWSLVLAECSCSTQSVKCSATIAQKWCRLNTSAIQAYPSDGLDMSVLVSQCLHAYTWPCSYIADSKPASKPPCIYWLFLWQLAVKVTSAVGMFGRGYASEL